MLVFLIWVWISEILSSKYTSYFLMERGMLSLTLRSSTWHFHIIIFSIEIVNLSKMPDHHWGALWLLISLPPLPQGTLPLAFRLSPSSSFEEFPPHPSSTPSPLSSVLQGGSSVLPDSRPDENHQLSQRMVILHFSMDHFLWVLSATFSNLHNSLNSTPSQQNPLDLPESSYPAGMPRPEPPLPCICSVSLPAFSGILCSYYLFSTPLVFVSSMDPYHQHFLSLLNFFQP